MNRIFSVEFNFKDMCSRAIISVAGKEDQPYYHIQFIDKNFSQIFSTQHIRFKGKEGYKGLSLYKIAPFRQVLSTIIASIQQEMTIKHPIVRRLWQ